MEKSRNKSLRFGGSGMRGEIGALNPTIVIQFAAALGTYSEGGKIVVVRDERASSTMVANAVFAGLTATGCKVIDAGVAPASFLHWIIPTLNADAGVLIGGGHHPAGWNAVLAYAADGSVFNAVQMQELLDIYHAHQYEFSTWDTIGKIEKIDTNEYREKYFDHICKDIRLDAIRERKLQVVMDYCAGSGGAFGDAFAARLGFHHIPINNIPSGILPHSPEPRPRSSVQVQSIVKALHADIGFVFNTDMTRFSVVTNSGETLSEEYSYPLVANYMLAEVYPKGTPLVSNTCSSRSLSDIAERYGAQVVQTGPGPSLIIDKMREINAPIGGEGAGSVAFLNLIHGYDSFHAVARILEAMSTQNKTADELAAQIPRYHIVKRAVNCNFIHGYALLHSLRNSFPEAQITEADGIRFDFPDGWIFLRAASTEPIIRMIVEFENKETAEDKAVFVRGLIERGMSL